jgi:hypothetical protein
MWYRMYKSYIIPSPRLGGNPDLSKKPPSQATFNYNLLLSSTELVLVKAYS